MIHRRQKTCFCSVEIGNTTFFKADLLDEGAFDALVDGCEGIFHKASSAVHSINDPGAQTFPNIVYRFVDVRDVAYAHIQAFEVPSASGRYCLSGRVAHIIEVVKILKELYLSLNLPEKKFSFASIEKHAYAAFRKSSQALRIFPISYVRWYL